ncbi:MAG TPA: aldo/keto reductase [Chitinophagaceae bacterium]|nr:aldo/keto reductase [Chitinophagaceae bacterium]
MHYHQLGSSALHISEISFGSMSLTPQHPGPAAVLHQAIDMGINFFDTADLYDKGWNETMLGKALLPKRKGIMIATKAGNVWNEDGKSWSWDPSKKHILSATEKSLQRLQTDYIDLLQLHGGTIDDPIDEVIEAFEQLKQEGKIRYYGISSIRPDVIREYVQRSAITSVMLQYSLLDRRPEETCLPLLREKGIGVLARGSIARGLLAGKPSTSYLGYTAGEVKQAAAAIKKVAGNKTAAQTATQFALNHPAVTSVVAGIRTPAQLAEAAGISEATPLQPEIYRQLQNVLPVNYYETHR